MSAHALLLWLGEQEQLICQQLTPPPPLHGSFHLLCSYSFNGFDSSIGTKGSDRSGGSNGCIIVLVILMLLVFLMVIKHVLMVFIIDYNGSGML